MYNIILAAYLLLLVDGIYTLLKIRIKRLTHYQLIIINIYNRLVRLTVKAKYIQIKPIRESQVTQYFPRKKRATNLINIFGKDRDKPAFFIPKKVQPILAAFFMKFPRSNLKKKFFFYFSGNIVGISGYSNFLENLIFSNFFLAKIIWNIGKFPGSFFFVILADLVGGFFSRVFKLLKFLPC